MSAPPLASLSPEQKAKLRRKLEAVDHPFLYAWPAWARPDQLAPPGNWSVWLLLAGRGFGKTLAICQWVRDQIENHGCKNVGIVCRTAADARDVVIEGTSGLLRICPPWARPSYEPSKRRLTWPNGAQAICYSSEEPDSIRGQNFDGLACDELAAWASRDAWDQAQFALRGGSNPRTVVATTPQNKELIRELYARAGIDVHLTTGTTFDNEANLPPGFLNNMID